MASGHYTMRGLIAQARRDPRPNAQLGKRKPKMPLRTFREEPSVSFPQTVQPKPTDAISAHDLAASIESLRAPALPEIDARCGTLTRTLMEASRDSEADASNAQAHRSPISVRIANATKEKDTVSTTLPPVAEVAPDALGKLSQQSAERILALTDTSTMTTVEDALARIDEVASLYSAAKDARGIFPVTYRVITQRARLGVEEGSFEHEDWARALIVQFAERFLVNLRAHMTGAEVSPAWKTYFDRADDQKISVPGVLGSGIFAHLVDDLPLTLAEIQSKPEQAEDFTKFGILLLEVYPDLVEAVGKHYEADVAPLLSGFAAGKLVDHVWGDGSTTELLFQSIRQKAWIMGQRLQKDCTSDIARFEMEQSLAVLQFALRGLT